MAKSILKEFNKSIAEEQENSADQTAAMHSLYARGIKSFALADDSVARYHDAGNWGNKKNISYR